ncbi:unnamed protein product [Hermetia illucens]|uniref:Transcriptional regulator n=1 Tax=Hermetia illucens TaxID=343691 RepID=A0A7R8Z5L5_HERIL|nr:probable transcriptional regulatory protein Fnod_1106 [Hermetia illucens]CAD7094082.1 unnamed protein product [Hermetia illucens]
MALSSPLRRSLRGAYCFLPVLCQQSSYIHTTESCAAGHSKWANIRHIKAAKDGQRAILFSRLVRQIRMAIQEGGSPNPQINSVLRYAIDDAIKKNMPMSTVQTTIKRFEESQGQLKKHCLEIKIVNTPIYMVCVLYTDNLAGLRMQLTPVLKKSGGAFIDARHLFEGRGVIETTITDQVMERSVETKLNEICTDDAIECGAEEVEVVSEVAGSVNFFCDPVELNKVSRALVDRGYRVESAEHVFIPKTPVKVSESDQILCDTVRDKLKAFDGVDEVYDNIYFE